MQFSIKKIKKLDSNHMLSIKDYILIVFWDKWYITRSNWGILLFKQLPDRRCFDEWALWDLEDNRLEGWIGWNSHFSSIFKKTKSQKKWTVYSSLFSSLNTSTTPSTITITKDPGSSPTSHTLSPSDCHHHHPVEAISQKLRLIFALFICLSSSLAENPIHSIS